MQAAGARRRGDVLRVATWRLEAGGTASPELMLAAARMARNRWDLPLAGRLAEAAIRVGAGFEAALLEAEVSALEGRSQEADQQLVALLPLAADDAQRARVAAARVDNLVGRLGQFDMALRVVEEARNHISDRRACDLLAAKEAYALQLGGRITEAFTIVEPLLARCDDPSLTFAWYTAGSCLTRSGRFGEASRLIETLTEFRRAETDSQAPLHPAFDSVLQCAVGAGAGRLHEAHELATSEYAAGVRSESRTLQAMFSMHLARIEIVMGRLKDAARHATESRNLYREKKWRNLQRSALVQLGLAQALLGSVDQARTALEEIGSLGLPEDDLSLVDFRRTQAWIAVGDGDLTAAHGHLAEAAQVARDRGDLLWECEARYDLARLGRAPDVAGRLRELATIVEGDLVEARADHAEAIAADDAARLDRVSVMFEAMGADLAAAEAAAAVAVLLRRAGEARRATGAELRASMLIGRCQGAATPALRATKAQAQLSNREIEVAGLAATGLANREIADRLSVSVRTVENHLQRVYGKLGLERRTDLAKSLTAF